MTPRTSSLLASLSWIVIIGAAAPQAQALFIPSWSQAAKGRVAVQKSEELYIVGRPYLLETFQEPWVGSRVASNSSPGVATVTYKETNSGGSVSYFTVKPLKPGATVVTFQVVGTQIKVDFTLRVGAYVRCDEATLTQSIDVPGGFKMASNKPNPYSLKLRYQTGEARRAGNQLRCEYNLQGPDVDSLLSPAIATKSGAPVGAGCPATLSVRHSMTEASGAPSVASFKLESSAASYRFRPGTAARANVTAVCSYWPPTFVTVVAPVPAGLYCSQEGYNFLCR